MLEVSWGMRCRRTPSDFDNLPAGKAKVARDGIRLLDAWELRFLQTAGGQHGARPRNLLALEELGLFVGGEHLVFRHELMVRDVD